MEILAGLFCIGVTLLVVALVGHGLWVAVAWLLQGARSTSEIGKPCSRCGARFGVQEGRCVACGAVPNVGTARSALREELLATSRQLRRLLDTGAITSEQYIGIVKALEMELARVPLPEIPAPAAVATPAAVAPVLARQDDVIEAMVVEAAPAAQPRFAAQPTATQASPVAATQPVASAVHPLDRPEVPVAPKAPVQAARPLADVLQSFMEESNIRWGEILAAMLIVFSSVGLVVSLRTQLKQIPFFPAILFTGFTVAFHGAGMYTLRRWNLQAVSRVILIISLLLVPLSFAGAVVMSGQGEGQRAVTDPLFLAFLAMGIGVFTWVAHSASRELVGRGAWPLAIAVVGCSASQTLIHRVEFAGMDVWRLAAIAAVPIASFLVAAVWQLVAARGRRQLSKPRVEQILLLLGVAVFALAAPLVMILARSEMRWSTVARLSPELSLVAAAIMALGVVIHTRTTAKRLAAWQTVGTAIVVLGGVLLVMLVGFAWPEPELLLAVGLINCVVLAALGVIAGLPVLYVPAVACAGLAATIGVHLASGHFEIREGLAERVVQAGLMGRTSVVLTVLGAVMAGIGVWRARRQRMDEAGMLLASVCGLGLVAIAIAVFSGFVTVAGWVQDRDWAAWVLVLYGVVLIAAGPLSRWPNILSQVAKSLVDEEKQRNDLRDLEVFWNAIVGLGSLLVWAAIVQALLVNSAVREWLAGMNGLPPRPIVVATIGHGVLLAFTAAIATGRGIWAGAEEFCAIQATRRWELLATPLAVCAAIAMTFVAPFVVAVQGGQFNTAAVMALWVAAAWGLITASQRWQFAISAMQLMAALVAALHLAGDWSVAMVQRMPKETFWAETHWLTQIGAVAVAGMFWSGLRRISSRRQVLRELLYARWPSVDQMLLAAGVVILPLVVMWAVIPRVGWELGFGEEGVQRLFAERPFVFGSVYADWLALGLVIAALVVSLYERVTPAATIGIGVASFAAVWMVARQFSGEVATASAARWAASIYAAVWGGLYISRGAIAATTKQMSALRWATFGEQIRQWFLAQPLVLGGATILIITILAVEQNASGVTLRGPAAESIFARIGPTVSYAGPLLALVAVLLGYAVRERQAGFALSGAGVFQLAINLAFVLYVSTTAKEPTSTRVIECLQWNSVAAGAYALVWLALVRWITPRSVGEWERRVADAMWAVPAAVGGVMAGALVIAGAWLVFERPALPPAALSLLGGWLSYVALGVLVAAVIWKGSAGASPSRIGSDAVMWLVAGLVVLVAATMNRFDAGGQWIAFHALETGWLVVGAVAGALVVAGTLQFSVFSFQKWWQVWHGSVAMLMLLVVTWAIRGNERDPGQPWWSMAGTLGAGVIAAGLGLARRSQPYAFLSTGLAGLAVILLWAAPGAWPWLALLSQDSDLARFAGLEFFAVAVIAAAGFWLWREIASQQRWERSLDARAHMPRVHGFVAVVFVLLHCCTRLVIAATYPGMSRLSGFDVSLILVTASLGTLLLAALWDRRAVWTIPLAFLWGAASWCLVIGLAGGWVREPIERVVVLFLAAAGHVAVAGQFWSYGANLAAWGTRVGISDPVGGLSRTARWLPAVSLALAALVCVVDFMLVLTLERMPLRVAAAWGPAVAAWGIVCLAQGQRRDAFQLLSLLVAGLTAILLGWAELDPDSTPELWLTRVFRLLMVLAALTFGYGLVLPRTLFRAGSWNAATRKAGHVSGVSALATFVATLVLEMALFRPGVGAPVDDLQVWAIAVVLLGLIAGLISLALLPGRDPLMLSEKGRQGYVYAAQATAALLFAHLYVCKPLWFDGMLRPYWPFVVMGLAFVGVGAAELFQRWKVNVLAEPLSRTGAMLPILPVLGMWVVTAKADYALVLFVVGILYLGLSYTRKSWAAMVAAGMAGNGALWALWAESEQFAFAEHPQFWLIPPALSVLVAAQVNRRRLAPEMLAAIRYAATIVLYLSSTSEIFIRGIGESIVPAMILMGLAVAGALAGMALRVRAFLILGMMFTLLSLVSMVWHASRSLEHWWPWPVFGIVLGVAILVLLGVFEKKREEVMGLIARLREWEK